MNPLLERTIKAAIAEGLLPPSAAAPQEAERPWPVILLTALGAWLAAIPLMISVHILIGDVLFRGAAPYFVGVLAIWQSIVLLRVKNLPVFVEQLAVPLMLMGGIALGIATFRDMDDQAAALAMAAASLAAAYFVPQAWLRTILGVAACAFTVEALNPRWDAGHHDSTLFGLLGVVALWLSMQWLLARRPLHAVPGLGEVASGWVIAALAGLAFWSGMTFLGGASIGYSGEGSAAPGATSFGPTVQAISLLLAGAAAAWTGRCWPSLRTLWSTAAASVVLALAWLMPSLGAVLLILAVCATQRRWRLAATAGVACAWIIGAFYYQLAYPLATKAQIMVGAGALLGVIAWIALRCERVMQQGATSKDSRRARLGIACSALLVLAVANFSIWQKETLIAEGQPVFIELGPVDPRSLIQGDYMRLAFMLPAVDTTTFERAQRPRAVGSIDARGVVTLVRVDQAGALVPGEIGIALTRTSNGWTVATDAWYFPEGDGERLARARYGEFRVMPDGRALLVGLRGPRLEALTP